MLRPFLLLVLIFCSWSPDSYAGIGRPESTIRLGTIGTGDMLRDSVPASQAPAAEKKDVVIKEVPKARKQIKPVALEKTPLTGTAVKPIIKPVIKPVVKPVIKPVIRIH